MELRSDQGRGQKTALIYDSPITGNKSQFTYEELRSKVSKFAGALKAQGANKGDRVIIYMPMIPEAVEAMLATVRLGGIHAVVFGGKLSLVKTIFIRPEDFCFFRSAAPVSVFSLAEITTSASCRPGPPGPMF